MWRSGFAPWAGVPTTSEVASFTKFYREEILTWKQVGARAKIQPE